MHSNLRGTGTCLWSFCAFRESNDFPVVGGSFLLVKRRHIALECYVPRDEPIMIENEGTAYMNKVAMFYL